MPSNPVSLIRVREAKAASEEAALAFHASILAARRDGATLRQIADAAGVSYQRVWQIVRGR